MTSSLKEVAFIKTKDGHMKLIAAVIGLAVDDSRAGDESAWEWLQEDARAWLSWLLPEHGDLDQLHEAVIEYARPRRPIQRELEVA